MSKEEISPNQSKEPRKKTKLETIYLTAKLAIFAIASLHLTLQSMKWLRDVHEVSPPDHPHQFSVPSEEEVAICLLEVQSLYPQIKIFHESVRVTNKGKRAHPDFFIVVEDDNNIVTTGRTPPGRIIEAKAHTPNPDQATTIANGISPDSSFIVCTANDRAQLSNAPIQQIANYFLGPELLATLTQD